MQYARTRLVLIVWLFPFLEFAAILAQSTLDISKSKFIPNYRYLEVNFLVPEIYFEMSVVSDAELKCKQKLIFLISKDILRYHCLRYRELTIYISVCDPGLYGQDCGTTCGNCRNNSICDPVSGLCEDGCEVGYQGSICKDSE